MISDQNRHLRSRGSESGIFALVSTEDNAKHPSGFSPQDGIFI